jgi:CheY-like chemotaxis protein
MESKTMLLVQDNADDEALMVRALRKNKILNEIVVGRDGAEALDYLYGTGTHQGRDPGKRPTVVLLDLNLPRVGGLEVLRRRRADERTRTLTLSAPGPATASRLLAITATTCPTQKKTFTTSRRRNMRTSRLPCASSSIATAI